MKIKQDWFRYIHMNRAREIERIFLRCPEKVFPTGLELGAGDGFQSALLTRYVLKLISTDYNSDRLNKKSGGAVTYEICDAEEIDKIFNHEQFDLVFSSNLLEHLPHPERALQAIRRVLKNNGIMIHIIPNPFWKLCDLLFHFPNICVRAVEKITEDGLFRSEMKRGFENNLKTERKKRPLPARLFIPEPHGVSANNIKEFYLFSKSRWKKEFEKAGFSLIAIIKGPVASGYGFGLNNMRNFLERMGISSEYVYVAVRKDGGSRFQKYFNQ